jgi:hypothetical protein
MKNQLKRAAFLAVALVLTMSLFASIEANAADINSGARLLRAEYQGVELSRNRQNPTVLKWTGEDIFIGLIGNSACGTLSDANVQLLFEGVLSGGGSISFSYSGRSGWFINNPKHMYVGNDVFEVYWNILCMVEKIDNESSKWDTIPNSETPKYYITFNEGGANHEVPHGDEPAIVRAEFKDVELSKDINNPTIIPYFNSIKLVGNTACKSKTISVWTWYNDIFTRSGSVVYFNSSALGSCSLGVAYEYEGNNGNTLYNETAKLEYAILNDDDETSPTKSPAYYVIVLDEESKYVDFAVNGLFHTVGLSGNQLIVEVKQGYIFDGSDMLLKDKTANKEYKLGIWVDNPDCAGVNTNRIVYSNLPLKIENIYELTIPAAAAYFKTGLNPNDFNNFKYNKEYTTELIMEGALTFPDVQDGNWAYPYVKELTEKRVMNGYEDGTFRPNSFVTRSEFAKMMTLSLQIPLLSSATPTFVDISQNDWEFIYVETAKKYLTGYHQDGRYYFKGKEPAVREDMAVALVKAMGIENQTVDLSELPTIFSDHETISQNLQKYVLIAYKNKLLDGYPDGTFGAQRTITRAETAALLSKVYKSDAMEKVTFD